MPNDLIKTLQEKGREILHDIVPHTPIKISETKGTEYDKGYIFYQDMVVRAVKDAEPLIDSLIANAVERGRGEVLDAAEGMKLIGPLEDVGGYGLGKDVGWNRALSSLLSKFRSDKG